MSPCRSVLRRPRSSRWPITAPRSSAAVAPRPPPPGGRRRVGRRGEPLRAPTPETMAAWTVLPGWPCTGRTKTALSRSRPTVVAFRWLTRADYAARGGRERAAPDLPSTGGDRPKIRRALERFPRSRFGQESVETLSAEHVDGAEAVAALNSLGLFAGGGCLVIVEEVERWKKVDEEAIAGYLADPVAGAVLALVSAELKGSALPALCAKAGEVLLRRAEASRPSYLGSRAVRAPGCGVGCRGEGTDRDRRRRRGRPRDRGREAGLPGQEGMRSAGARWSCRCSRAGSLGMGDHGRLGARDLPSALAACQSDLERGTDPFAVGMPLITGALVRQAQALAEEGLGAKDIAKRSASTSSGSARRSVMPRTTPVTSWTMQSSAWRRSTLP